MKGKFNYTHLFREIARQRHALSTNKPTNETNNNRKQLTICWTVNLNVVSGRRFTLVRGGKW